MAAELADVRREAEALLEGLPDGEALDELTATWVALGAAASPTRMDNAATRELLQRALDLGGTREQATELLIAISAIGFHTLHEGGRVLADVLRERGDAAVLGPLSPEQEALRDRHVGDDAYWRRLEARLPGFLDALLRLSGEAFAAFFAVNAIPWRSRQLDARTKELVYVALDAAPSHRYLPGLRLHVENALRVGATPAQIRQTLEIAAAAGPHAGVS